MSKDYISVVMTTYNGEKYIKEQLDSIIRQTCTPNEIIIADDCSSDSTVNIVKSYNNKTDIEIINYVNNHNLGYIQNFKNAISKARGEYIFLCDQDDVWNDKKIEKTVKLMKEHNASIACTGFSLIDKDGFVIKDLECYKSDPISGYCNWSYSVKKISINRLVWGNFCPGCTYCFNRDVLNVFNDLKNTELSHDFQLLLIGANHGSAIYIDMPLSKYRLHGANTVGMNNKEAKRSRHIKPRLTRFFDELAEIERVKNVLYLNTILYLRLPKIRSVVIHMFHLNNNWI